MGNPGIQTFGKYQILERIATGGMAEIYKARLEGIGGFQRTFAIKRILPNLSQNLEYIAMLVDEAKVAGLLSHANIVQILDLGQVDGIWYIAMEYVQGRDLGGVLRRARHKGLCLPVPHCVFCTIELLKGLEYAHQRQVMRGGRPVALNIIHRDVSPPNILLSFQGEVKLTDFGIARASLKAMETISGIVKGRFDYMSPEQAAGAKDLDQRSDLFSVGVVLYEMLTGHHPFRTDNELGTIERVRTGTYTPVSQRNPEVPFALETIVDRALRVDRDERYPTATAFKEALDKFFHDAGFIFTHATLASYVKGLFPEEAKPGGSKSVIEEHTTTTSRRVSAGRRPTPAGGNSLEEHTLTNPELPTHRLDRRLMVNETPPLAPGNADLEPTHILKAPDFLSDNDEQETLIRKVEWEDQLETVIRPGEEDVEQETVIRRSPLDDPTGYGFDEPSTGFEDLSAARRRSSSLTSRPRPTRIGWVGWILSVLMLGTGLVFGSVTALVVGYAAGFRLSSAATQRPPTIRVLAPPGTSVKVNGDAVASEVTVPPGIPQRVEIIVKGREPWIQELTLEPGEYRFIVLTVVKPKKQQ